MRRLRNIKHFEEKKGQDAEGEHVAAEESARSQEVKIYF